MEDRWKSQISVFACDLHHSSLSGPENSLQVSSSLDLLSLEERTEECAALFRRCSPPVTFVHPSCSTSFSASLSSALSGSLTPHNDSSSCTSPPPPPPSTLNILQLQERKWPRNVFTVFLEQSTFGSFLSCADPHDRDTKVGVTTEL